MSEVNEERYLEIPINGVTHYFEYYTNSDGSLWCFDDTKVNPLSGRQADIFVYLHRRMGEFVDTEAVVCAVWGVEHGSAEAKQKMKSFYTFIYRLRRKIAPQYLIIRARNRTKLMKMQ